MTTLTDQTWNSTCACILQPHPCERSGEVVHVSRVGKPLTCLLDGVRHGGRVAFSHGVEPAPRKRRGVSLQSYDATPGVREFERLGRAIAAARLEVPIAASYPLALAAKAHAWLARRRVRGKIMLRVRDR